MSRRKGGFFLVRLGGARPIENLASVAADVRHRLAGAGLNSPRPRNGGDVPTRQSGTALYVCLAASTLPALRRDPSGAPGRPVRRAGRSPRLVCSASARLPCSRKGSDTAELIVSDRDSPAHAGLLVRRIGSVLTAASSAASWPAAAAPGARSGRASPPQYRHPVPVPSRRSRSARSRSSRAPRF
jgi:hypothetical protein